jgi:uncharacterized protein
MERYLKQAIQGDLSSKIILLMGPRQCGKTTLSKMLLPDYQYINYDFAEHRMLLREKAWDRSKDLIILDELHKMQEWKSWLKGIYDVEGIPPALLVTGSAKLSAFRKTGDSLAGRHFAFRLHPLDFKEARTFLTLSDDEIFRRLMAVGGFPEPFLRGTPRFYNRWKQSHIDLILREDLLNLSAVRDIQSIETLIELLRSRVGSPVSSNSLARDLQKSPKTVQHWLSLLEDLYVIFKITPYHKNIARGLLKEPKYYFYDNGMVLGDEGSKLENLVACAVLKEVDRVKDVNGEHYSLHYIKNKDGREIDFCLTKDKIPVKLLEVKWRNATLTPNFKTFLTDANLERIQIVGELHQGKSYPSGEKIMSAKKFLGDFCL